MATGFCEVEFEDLIFLEKAGGGTFGSVYRAIWKPHEMEVAVKKLLVLDKEVGIYCCTILYHDQKIVTTLIVYYIHIIYV